MPPLGEWMRLACNGPWQIVFLCSRIWYTHRFGADGNCVVIAMKRNAEQYGFIIKRKKEALGDSSWTPTIRGESLTNQAQDPWS